jgi:hypothetical protein
MTMTRMIPHAVVLTATLMLTRPIGVAAQAPPPPPPPPGPGVFFERRIEINVGDAGPDANIAFMAAPITFDNETVTGAPYSAEAITEVVQPLADGNRIVRQSKSQLARDSAGRTRREQSLSILGPMVNTPDDGRQVQISDPQADTIVMLDVKNKRARKMPSPKIRVMTRNTGQGTAVPAPPTPPPPPLPPAPPLLGPDAFGGPTVFYSAETRGVRTKPQIESLGKQFIEGVEAEGTRTTFTIPAGQIGNELPINVVSERWYSAELKLLVMSRQSDPRFGETTYRLTNITRGEPSPTLFEVPADFTVDEAGRQGDVMIRKMAK